MLKESSLFIILLDFRKKNKTFRIKKSVNVRTYKNIKRQEISHFSHKMSLGENRTRD